MCWKIQILILHGAKANKISDFLNLLTVPDLTQVQRILEFNLLHSVFFSCSILGEKPVDSLQLMIEASDSANESKKLQDDEITGNAFVFILAG